MFWVNPMKIVYRREMYLNQKKSGQCRQLVREYTCARRTSKWPFRLFMNMLDIGALNSYVIWMLKNVNWSSRKPNRRYHFLMELGKELTKPNILRRACNPIGFTLRVRRAIERMGFSVASNPECSSSSTRRSNEKRKRGRCFRCSRKDDRKVTTFCSNCKRFICKQHRVTITTVACVRNCEGDRDWIVWWWAWWQWIQKLFCKICSQYIDRT